MARKAYAEREPCIEPGCDREDIKGRGLCNKCYGRRRYRGTLPPPTTDLERFMFYVQPLPIFGCWLWTGGLTEDGYGKFWVDGQTVPAHRWIFREMGGVVADDEDVDHVCFNRWCVNFGRCLRAASKRENWETSLSPARVNGLKTHCDDGHPFDVENTYWYPTASGWGRGCRRCITMRRRAREVVLQ